MRGRATLWEPAPAAGCVCAPDGRGHYESVDTQDGPVSTNAYYHLPSASHQSSKGGTEHWLLEAMSVSRDRCFLSQGSDSPNANLS